MLVGIVGYMATNALAMGVVINAIFGVGIGWGIWLGMGITLAQDVPLADITSGTFSPTLKKGIGLALIPTMVAEDAQVGVDIRGRREIFQLVKPPFVDPSVRES